MSHQREQSNKSAVSDYKPLLRACLQGGPQVGEVTRLGEVKK